MPKKSHAIRLSTSLLRFWVGRGAATAQPRPSAAPKLTSSLASLLRGRWWHSSPSLLRHATGGWFSQGRFFGVGFAIVLGTSQILPQQTKERPWSRMGKSHHLESPHQPQPWLKASAGDRMLWRTLHQEDEANGDQEWQNHDSPEEVTQWHR